MATKNGTKGRVYGGDCNLIHVADGKRAAAGHLMARIATLRPYEREQYVLSQYQARYPGEHIIIHGPVSQ